MHSSRCKDNSNYWLNIIDIEKRAEVIRIVSAEDMYKAVMQRIESQDLFISCAAVADFRPKTY